jgi:DNA-binding NtrC family response regulator
MKLALSRERKHVRCQSDNKPLLIVRTGVYPTDIRLARSAFEARLLESVLRANRGNVSKSAEVLHLSRRRLQNKIQQLGIDIKSIRSEEGLSLACKRNKRTRTGSQE